MEKINVAIFSDSFYPVVGGRENAIDNLMRSLKPYVNNSILVTANFKGQSNFIEDKDLPYKIARCNSIRLTKNEYLLTPNKKFKKEIENKIKSGEINIIHVETKYALAKYALKLKKKFNIPVITTAHTQYPIVYKKQLKCPLIYKTFINHVKSVINKTNLCLTVSQYMQSILQKMKVKTKTIIIPNGNDLNLSMIDNNITQTIKNKYNIKAEDNIFVFVGRILEVKNISLLIDSLKILKDNNHNFKMFFIGNGNIDHYKNVCKEKELVDNCIFTGAIADRQYLANFIHLADLFLFPSISESFGLVVREAGSLKVPSIVVENQATSENIINNKNGFISKATATDFAEKIMYAIKNKSELKHIGENASKTFTTTWDEVAREHAKIYENTIKRTI